MNRFRKKLIYLGKFKRKEQKGKALVFLSKYKKPEITSLISTDEPICDFVRYNTLGVYFTFTANYAVVSWKQIVFKIVPTGGKFGLGIFCSLSV
jgi:hypothetical protein